MAEEARRNPSFVSLVDRPIVLGTQFLLFAQLLRRLRRRRFVSSPLLRRFSRRVLDFLYPCLAALESISRLFRNRNTRRTEAGIVGNRAFAAMALVPSARETPVGLFSSGDSFASASYHFRLQIATSNQNLSHLVPAPVLRLLDSFSYRGIPNRWNRPTRLQTQSLDCQSDSPLSKTSHLPQTYRNASRATPKRRSSTPTSNSCYFHTANLEQIYSRLLKNHTRHLSNPSVSGLPSNTLRRPSTRSFSTPRTFSQTRTSRNTPEARCL